MNDEPELEVCCTCLQPFWSQGDLECSGCVLLSMKFLDKLSELGDEDEKTPIL